MQEQQFTQKWMKDYEVVLGDEIETVPVTEFAKMLDSNKGGNFAEGEVFQGQVITVGSEYVTVDIGYKQEGLVSVKEFQNYDGTLKIKPGELIEVYLEKLTILWNLVIVIPTQWVN